MVWDTVTGALNAACLTTFGRKVHYRPVVGASLTIRGILQTGAQLEESAPGVYAMLFLQAADLLSPAERGDAVEIAGIRYKVFEVEADAAGGLKLALRLE